MQRLIRVFLVGLMLSPLPAQGGSPRGVRGGHDRERLAEMLRHLPPGEREQRMHQWRELVAGLDAEERRRFVSLTFEEKQAFVRNRLARLRAAQDAAFVASLDEAEQESLSTLEPKDRARRILELRVEKQLEKVLGVAVEEGLLTHEQALAEHDGSLAQRAEKILSYQKRIFVHVHGQAFAELDDRHRNIVLLKPPREFFRDPFVQSFELRGLFDPVRLRALELGGPDAVKEFLDALRRRHVPPEVRRHFTAEGWAAFERMRADERRRTINRLARVLALSRPAPHGPEQGSTERGAAPRKLLEAFESLSAEEQRNLIRLPPAERRRFLLRRFPELAEHDERSREDGRTRAAADAPTLRELLDALAPLSDAEREALLDLPLREVIRRLLSPERRGPGREGPGR